MEAEKVVEFFDPETNEVLWRFELKNKKVRVFKKDASTEDPPAHFRAVAMQELKGE